MTIHIGADHRGFLLKEALIKHFELTGQAVLDYGAVSFVDGDDYPVYARAVAGAVSRQEGSIGIVICGSGIGVSIAANKIRGIRAGLVRDVATAISARNDDDCNVLALGADVTPIQEALDIVDAFIATPFSREERHERRISEIE